MKITHISDTHGYHSHLKLEGGDVLIHSGDFTGGRIRELKQFLSFLNWMSSQRYKHKVLVAGNHDFVCETMGYYEVKNITDSFGIDYLCDSGTWVGGRLFWGSPWQPEYGGWAFNLPRDGYRIEQKWLNIPMKTSVLVTHGPPKDILDCNDDLEPCGCARLKTRVLELPNLELHCFGHIHEAYSAQPRFIEAGVAPFLASNASIWNHLHSNLSLNQPVNLHLD